MEPPLRRATELAGESAQQLAGDLAPRRDARAARTGRSARGRLPRAGGSRRPRAGLGARSEDAARPSQRATWSMSSSSPRSIAATRWPRRDRYRVVAGVCGLGDRRAEVLELGRDGRDVLPGLVAAGRGPRTAASAARATSSSGAWSTNESAGSARGTARSSPTSATRRASDGVAGVVKGFVESSCVRTIRVQVSLKSSEFLRGLVRRPAAIASAGNRGSRWRSQWNGT